jgi:hypothetical protein
MGGISSNESPNMETLIDLTEQYTELELLADASGFVDLIMRTDDGSKLTLRVPRALLYNLRTLEEE